MILWIGLVLFASTNIDDLFVLLPFFADPAFRARNVVIGQYLGMIVLIGISLLGAVGTRVIPFEYVGLLGVLPILLGVKKLFELRKRRGKPEPEPERGPDRSSAVQPLVVAAITIANGGDNLGAYVPVFATHSLHEVVILVVTFLVLTGVFCFGAHRLVNHPRAGAPIRRYGRVIVPFALIALGVYILWA